MRFLDRLTSRMNPLEDPGIFAQFYENTHQNTYRYIMALSGGIESLAEDITADAYLRAWKNRHSFTGSSDAALGWVLTIARRILIDKYRGTSSHPPETDLPESIVDNEPDPEGILLGKELTRQVIEALQRLPENQREMVVLRYVLGWHVDQIAEHLAIPENTVSVSLRRSLKRLQEFLVLQGVQYERPE